MYKILLVVLLLLRNKTKNLTCFVNWQRQPGVLGGAGLQDTKIIASHIEKVNYSYSIILWATLFILSTLSAHHWWAVFEFFNTKATLGLYSKFFGSLRFDVCWRPHVSLTFDNSSKIDAIFAKAMIIWWSAIVSCITTRPGVRRCSYPIWLVYRTARIAILWTTPKK